MALDNAQFISELSITDPPGTDPVAEGDDHIRTTKRATQQSFPNVDAAVPQTAAQMAQMAIKNEVNVFTQINTFSAPDTQFTESIHIQKQADNSIADIRYQDAAGFNRWIVRYDSDTLDDAYNIQRRDAAGAFLDNPISISGVNAFINFNTIAAAFFGQALRFETALTPSTSVQTGALFIGGSGTLRWSLSRQADDVTGDLVINRHDGGGTLQNTPFRIEQATGNAVLQRNSQRLTFLNTAADQAIQMGLLTDSSGFMQMAHGGGVAGADLLFRSDNGGQNYIMGDATATGTRRLGIGTSSPARTVHIVLPAASGDDTPLRLTGLPTSSAGLSSGDCWNSSNFIAIIP